MKKPSKKASHPHGVPQRKAMAMNLAPPPMAAPVAAPMAAPAAAPPMAMKKGGKVCSKK